MQIPTLEKNDDSDFKEIAESSHIKLSSSLLKVGYSDGIVAGKDSAFQTGFDKGYFEGLRIAIQLSAWKSFVQNVNTNINNKHGQEFSRELQTFLQTPDILENLKTMQSDSPSVQDILEVQRSYFTKITNELKENFPIISSFINFK